MTVTHKFQFSGISRNCLLCGEGKGHELHALPTFEAGKSYRTRGLGVATVDMIAEHGTIHGAAGGHSHVIWAKSGLLNPPGHSEYDLLPGAIEDEPKPESPAESVDIYRFNKLRGDLMDVVAWVTEITGKPWLDRKPQSMPSLQEQINAMRSAEAEPPPEVLERERMSDLRQIHSRLNRLVDRVDELTTRCTNLGHKADGAHTRIGAVEREMDKRIDKSVTELLERIEGLEKAAEAMPGPYALAQRLDALEEQMTSALGITLSSRPRPATPIEQAINALRERLDHQSEAIDQLNQNADRRLNELEERVNRQHFEKAMSAGCYGGSPKPTIKGGWVNVYPEKHARCGTWLSNQYPTKEMADHEAMTTRIACIQIPDIQEGEGL